MTICSLRKLADIMPDIIDLFGMSICSHKLMYLVTIYKSLLATVLCEFLENLATCGHENFLVGALVHHNAMRYAWSILDILHIGIFQPILQHGQDEDQACGTELRERQHGQLEHFTARQHTAQALPDMNFLEYPSRSSPHAAIWHAAFSRRRAVERFTLAY